MRKLLAANFQRMRKDKLFYIGIIVLLGAIAIGLYKSYTYLHGHPDETIPLDIFLFMESKLAIIVSAIFSGFFVGTEYSDKTMRNKIIAGHSRSSIYMANLVTCTAAALIFFLLPVVATFSAHLLLGGEFISSPQMLIQVLLCSILSVIAFMSLILLMVMLIANKAIGSIAVLITVILMFMAAAEVQNKLAEPGMIQGIANIGSDGTTIEYSEEPNPLHLSGAARVTYQVLYDALPACQLQQYDSDILPKNVSVFPVYALIVILVSSGVGIAVFRKKNLR